MDFTGTGAALSIMAKMQAAEAIGCELATIEAVLDVEAAGRGFDAKKRPKILFEPHVFWRELGPGKKRDAAAEQELAYAKWGAKPYPKTSDANYARLERACAIDETAALRSCSWGLPQIMGGNHSAAGYPTPQAMVEAFKTGEDAQIGAFARLIINWGLKDELQRRDWSGFAKRYNGPGYAKNGYHTKLAAAYARRSAGKNAPPRPDSGDVVLDIEARSPPAPQKPAAGKPKPAGPKAPAMDKTAVAGLQEALDACGYHEVGKVDGLWGPRTTNALAAFQRDNGLPATGRVDDATLAKLALRPARPIAKERADAKVEDVVEDAPAIATPTLWATLLSRLQALGSAAVAAIYGVVSTLGDSEGALGSVKSFLADYPWIWITALVAVAFAIWAANSKALVGLRDGYRAGKVV